MAKYSGRRTRPQPTSPIATAEQATTKTFEGGVAYVPTDETELFLTAATHMAGEGNYYEDRTVRDDRLIALVHKATKVNPQFVAGLAKYVRHELLIRSGSIMIAAEYVKAGGPGGRAVVNSVLARGDEPAEMLGYWMGRYGRKLPAPIKRGVADGAVRLYNEWSALRYDGDSRAIRMGDVLELTHPKPKALWQSAMFKYLLDRRHHNDAKADDKILPRLRMAERLATLPEGDRRKLLRGELALVDQNLTATGTAALRRGGMTWERLSSWLPGGMDTEAWEAVIPVMGTMALARNLRNFDQAGISEQSIDFVIRKLTDPVAARKSRMFPYQVYSAYQYAPSDNWKRALGTMFGHTTSNVTPLDNTLLVVDMSGSMRTTITRRSKISMFEVASVMAASLAHRSENVDVVIFADRSQKVSIPSGQSPMQTVAQLCRMYGSVGYSTYGHTAINTWFDPGKHRRAVIVTDDQMHDSGQHDLSYVPSLYTIDLTGYKPRSMRQGRAGRYTIAGFTDSMFDVIRTLEAGRDGTWPFLSS